MITFTLKLVCLASLIHDGFGVSLAPPDRLRVEYMDAPMGVDVPKPRFSWILSQTQFTRGQSQSAYRIVVHREDGTLMWDSHKVTSSDTSQVVYGGTALKPESRLNWGVQWWDQAGNGPSEQVNATFTTGTTWGSESAFIGPGSGMGDDAALFRTTIDLSGDGPLQAAYLYVIGMGYYKLWIDGTKISDHELGPFTTFEQRALYDTWDVTNNLATQHTKHAIGVEVGRGWFAQKSIHAGTICVRAKLRLDFASGSTKYFYSNLKDWKTVGGPIEFDDIYNGETYDMRYEMPGWTMPEYDDSHWSAPQANSYNPAAISSHAVIPHIKIARTYSPVDLWQTGEDEYVYDFGQNMAGITTIHLPGALNTVSASNITLLHAELIFGPHGKIQHHYSNTKELQTLILDGSGRSKDYTSQFVYSGFRYVRITGYPGVPSFDTLTAHFIHTGFEMTGEISFSDPVMDAVQHATRMAALSNHQNIPTDCPQRERRGWLGDAQLSSETDIHNFDMAAAYFYFVQTIDDAQNKKNGEVPDCTPWYHHGGEPSDPAWGAAFTILPYNMWRYYGDVRALELHYESMQAYVNNLQSRTDPKHGNLLYFSRYGDWCPPPTIHKSCDQKSPLVSSLMFYTDLMNMAKFAQILNKPGNGSQWEKLAANVVTQYNKYFWDATKNRYDDGALVSVQTSQALSLAGGFADSTRATQTLKALTDAVESNHMRTTSGIVGIHYSLPVLAENGYLHYALNMVQDRQYPSFAYMVVNGATTLWESWEGTKYHAVSSRNHIMFGSNSAWSFQYLAGIRMNGDTNAFKSIEIAPGVVFDGAKHECYNLTSVQAQMLTINGVVTSSWTCGSTSCPTGKNLQATPKGEHCDRVASFKLQVQTSIPVNAVGNRVVVPLLGLAKSAATITESGKPVWQNGAYVPGVSGIAGAKAVSNGAAIAFEGVGSGAYNFELQ